MLSFTLTIVKLLQALVYAWREPDFRNVLVILLALLVSGTVFYSSVEGWSVIDSLYFSVVTLATVGYGDFVPKTTAGKLFTIIYLFVGIALFVAVAHGLAKGLFERRRDKHKK